eukprot:TRINITY_DN13719_c0_g1_i1.p1 TRINITY_DN13719_c0_g1~~TRINITY_DN13719_c0_g1_i1.p1  ORF type:complete len:815 (-),score=158.97 TRINITY_DN13719_c0_g1_i1:62-2506(-)
MAAPKADKVRALVDALTRSIFELEDEIFRLYSLLAATGREAEIGDKRILLETIVKLRNIFAFVPDSEAEDENESSKSKEWPVVKRFVRGARIALEGISDKLAWILDNLENEETPPELPEIIQWAKSIKEASAVLANDFEAYATVRPIKMYKRTEIFVRVSEAKALVSTSVTGTVDPYCAITLDGERKCRTQTVPKNASPCWLREFEMDVEPHMRVFGVHVFDKDRTMLTGDEIIAERGFMISDLEEVKYLENWFPLFPKGSAVAVLGTFHLKLRYKPPSVNGNSGSIFVTIVGAKDLEVNWCNLMIEEHPDVAALNPAEMSPTLVSPRALLQPRDNRSNIVVQQQYRTAEYNGTYTTNNPIWNETFSFRCPLSQLPQLVLRIQGMRGRMPYADGAVRLAGILLDPMQDFESEFGVRVEPSLASRKPSEIRLQLKLVSHKVLAAHAYDELLVTLIQGDDTIKFLASLLDPMPNKKETIKSLVGVLIERGVVNQFIKRAVAIEIEKTSDVGTLFRANSFASMALDSNLQLAGGDLLQRSLKEHISEIYKSKRNFEVDPARVNSKSGKSSSSVDKNMENLVSRMTAVWNSIQMCAEFVPQQIRSVFAHMAKCCRQKWPNDPNVSYLAASGFLFLRFFCAAILNPHLFNLSEEYPEEKVARNLTLVSKILMNLGNLVTFGAKELFLEPLNPFINENIPKMKNYLDFVGIKTIGTRAAPKTNYAKDMAHVHAFLKSKREKIEEELEKTQDVKIARILAALNRLDLFTSAEEERLKSSGTMQTPRTTQAAPPKTPRSTNSATTPRTSPPKENATPTPRNT